MKSRLILLNGFAGCGKTTIANRYVSEHPLSLSVEGDEIITRLGQWRENISEAIECKQVLLIAMIEAHLKRGHDVIIPYLLGDPKDVQRFESIAHVNGARFYEVTLSVERGEAIGRLFKRGTWGEEGLPSLTMADRPKAENLYDEMMEAVKMRPNMIAILSIEDDIENTYSKLLEKL